MAVRTFDFSKVILSVDGKNISGYADGTGIELERSDQSFTKVVGSDGATSRSKSNDRSGTLTITLMQTSPSNDILSAILARDEKNGNAVVSVLLKDMSGESRFFSGTAWIQKAPAITYGKEINNVAWMMDIADLEVNIAGNVGVGTESV